MSKLQEIESKLIGINDAVFQDLCDAYISATEPDCHTKVHRSGSVAGKQKSKKGTPDSFYTIANGNYVLCQYTTQSDKPKEALLKKIRDDIDACADKKKTGIETAQVERIIYCLNSNLQLPEYNELKSYAWRKGFYCDFRSLSQFAQGLMQNAPQLAHEFLGVEIDSGQVLPVENFIQVYEKSGHATPISNVFVGRNTELKELEESVTHNTVTIVAGAPGVGKTKLVMALFDKIGKENKFQIYCIDNRHIPIYQDLRSYILHDRDYILLVDDANRQMANMRQILQLLRENRKGELHIVITVRDYALEDIEKHAEWTNPHTVRVEKFTDEQIIALLASDGFGITNHLYTERIVDISGGNPRLAIMAGKVVLREQSVASLNDVSELYDQYFGAAISEELFKDNALLKALAIVSFFHIINKSEEPFYSTMLSHFGLDRFSFEASLIKLEQMELVESSSDLTMVRIADQVLGTYFFYRLFFKFPVLSFATVLDHYFFSHHSRVKDTVIPANNTFAYKNMLEKIDPFLLPFWVTVKDIPENAKKFLDIFWAYRQDEAVHFVYSAIKRLPVIDAPEFTFDPKHRRQGHEPKDMYLGVLAHFYPELPNKAATVLELGCMYVSKNPILYQEWVDTLRENFSFNRYDASQWYFRQHQVIDFLCKDLVNSEIEPIRISLFFDLVPALMKTSFQTVTGARKRNSITISRHDVILNEPLKNMRTAIWKRLADLFGSNEGKGLEFMRQYLERTPDKVKKVFEFDLPFVLRIFRCLFKAKHFTHCLIVHNFLQWFSRLGIKDDAFTALKTKFSSDTFLVFQKLSYDYLQKRAEELTRLPFDKYNERKEKEIREHFVFAGLPAFKKFYKQYQEMEKALDERIHTYKLYTSLDIILDQAFASNAKQGFAIIKHLITTGNKTTLVPWLFFDRLANDRKLNAKMYSLITKHNFEQKDRWLYNWFRFLPPAQLNENIVDDVKTLFRDARNSLFYIDFEHFEKFEVAFPGFMIELLEIIYDKNEAKELKLQIRDLVSEHLSKFTGNLPLLEKCYLQQQRLADHFDHDFKDLVEILRLDPEFITAYLQYWSKGPYMSLHDHEGLSVIWELRNAAAIIEKAFAWMEENITYNIGDEFATVFFKNIPHQRRQDAIKLLWDYLKKHFTSARSVEMVLDCAGENFQDEFEPMLLYFLAEEPSFEVFKKLQWSKKMMILPADTITGDLRAAEYQAVLEIVEKITEKAYLYSEHITYLKDWIRAEKRFGDQERRRKFYDNEW